MACERLVCALALCLGVAQDPLQRLNAAFAAGRIEEALEHARALEDPALGAEWTSYLHSQAGDIPGALRAARAGLALAPEHAGLLTQALNASLTLGLSESSTQLAERLRSLEGGSGAARSEELAGHARELAQREQLARRCIARSRAVVLAGLAMCSLGLLWFARTGRQ